MTDATAIAQGLQKIKSLPGNPILASWMGAGEVAEGEAILNASGIPTFKYPDAAVRSFCYMWRYRESLRAVYDTPALSAGELANGSGRARTETIIRAAQKTDRTLLNETEFKQI